MGPSKNISPVTVVEGKNYSSTNANYVYLPPDVRQIQSGYRGYEQGSANLQTGRNGYHGFQEMVPAHQMNDVYSGYFHRIRSQSIFATFRVHYALPYPRVAQEQVSLIRTRDKTMRKF